MMKPVRIMMVLLSGVAASCSSYTTRHAAQAKVDAVKEIVDQLVETAELRRDPQGMHVYMNEVNGTGKGKLDSTSAQSVAEDLQHYVLMEINKKLNILERGLTPSPDITGKGADLGEWAKKTGATHVLVGDYVVRGDDVCVSLRLVDVNTRLIVAAAGGMVPNEARRSPSPSRVAPRYRSSYRR